MQLCGMKILRKISQSTFTSLWMALGLMIAPSASGQGDDRLTGIWAMDEGFQVVELLLRSDGRYWLDKKSTDPFGVSIGEAGHYEVNGQEFALTPYDYFGEPQSKRYMMELSGDVLTLTHAEFGFSEVYQFQAGSREEVLARENVDPALVGTWGRHIQFFGRTEYTFRPGGYYFQKDIHEDSQFPPDIIRGRYEQDGNQIVLKPYSGVEARYEIDFFGNTVTLIKQTESSGEWATYELVPGSEAEVRAKAAEAEAFLSGENWPVGVWEIRGPVEYVDLTIRPDGYYIAKTDNEILRGMVRGRYTLEPRRIRLSPFIGQDLYSRSNGEFGKVERVRELDYYDGELQIIDLEALSQSVTIARKQAGSEAAVLEKTRQAQTERAREGWHIGIWEVNDPTGWMEFTFRPDHRYIAQAGANGIPSQVERGQYVLATNKFTLAPYTGLGNARGFELDFYDGDLYLIGDSYRMVIARKIAGSETGVIEKTQDPVATKGEGGEILGLWTAHLPGYSAELVFRPDGQFRLKRCAGEALTHDYGLYQVNMATRTLVSDSRFVIVQNHGLDFYGDTMTIYGGLGAPNTYTVNLGQVDAAIQASLAADAVEAQIDAQWLARVPVGPRDPNAVQIPVGDIPADPNPGMIFEAPTVFSHYQLYRRLIPGFVYFNDLGSIKSVAVVNTREWHFFPTGRVMVRFKNYSAGPFYPNTVADVSDSWGAYRIGPKPEERDILHIFADNTLFLESDLGEKMEMTLEDGRRNLFWGKDYMIQWEWASEQKTIPCQPPTNSNPSLINVRISLDTTIEPDLPQNQSPSSLRFTLTGPVSGNFTMSGTTTAAGALVVEGTTSLVPPIAWQPLQTNQVEAGPFSFQIPQGTNAAAYFRLREQ